jgi:acetylornithine deacetylase/succinyl-diaminopimelate desuccinylase-like protein
MNKTLPSLAACLTAWAGFSTVSAFAQTPSQYENKKFDDIYHELVEINTSNSVGDTTVAANAMKARLEAAGFAATDIQVIEPFPRKGNLVTRLKGSGEKKPLLLLAHIDVVEAKREEWQTDPFKITVKDGQYFARGAIDDKAMASAFVSILGQLKQEGFAPKRDIILALTADEERGGAPSNGAAWLIKNKPELIQAEFGLNEGGRGEYREGKPYANVIQLAEKTFAQYEFEATGPGGHSARPTPDNTIYDLADALVRLRKNQFPVVLSEETKAYFRQSAPQQTPDVRRDYLAVAGGSPSEAVVARLSAKPSIVGMLRTTCVATMAQAGHAPNALAQSAKATINCRMLPGASHADVEAALKSVAGTKVTVTSVRKDEASPGSPLNPELMKATESISASMWPGVPVIPTMGVSTTDSRRFRSAGIPMYGVSGLFVDPSNTGVHGLNEHVGIRELHDSREFLYRLVRQLAS